MARYDEEDKRNWAYIVIIIIIAVFTDFKIAKISVTANWEEALNISRYLHVENSADLWELNAFCHGSNLHKHGLVFFLPLNVCLQRGQTAPERREAVLTSAVWRQQKPRDPSAHRWCKPRCAVRKEIDHMVKRRNARCEGNEPFSPRRQFICPPTVVQIGVPFYIKVTDSISLFSHQEITIFCSNHLIVFCF